MFRHLKFTSPVSLPGSRQSSPFACPRRLGPPRVPDLFAGDAASTSSRRTTRGALVRTPSVLIVSFSRGSHRARRPGDLRGQVAFAGELPWAKVGMCAQLVRPIVGLDFEGVFTFSVRFRARPPAGRLEPSHDLQACHRLPDLGGERKRGTSAATSQAAGHRC